MKKTSDKEVERQLAALAVMRDEDIDTSDIPEITAEQFRSGVRGMFYRPVKKPVTMRLDADVIAWLKEDGKGYQTKANALLRSEMIRARIGKKRPKPVRAAAAKRKRSR
jgi:uncharacterized protein (DUF4415 family)